MRSLPQDSANVLRYNAKARIFKPRVSPSTYIALVCRNIVTVAGLCDCATVRLCDSRRAHPEAHVAALRKGGR
eukprot:5893833-Pyramimonas_sp.AAC.1